MEKIKKLFQKYEEIIRYLVVGVLTTLVSLLVYYALVYTVFNPKVAIEMQITNVIAWIVSVTFAYFTNRKYVFKTKDKVSGKEALGFYSSRVSTLLLDMLLMYVLVTLMGLNDKIIKLVVQVVVIVLNYVLSKFMVFKKK